MVAEVQLYWIIYNKCSLAKNDLVDTKLALEAWQREWIRLFSKPSCFSAYITLIN
jgi:hypothetical protein